MKDVRASQGAFISLFSRMEGFFLRLEKYIKVRPTVAMRDIIVKIIVEVLSILGIMTKEIGQGSMSASFRVDISAKADVCAEKFFKKLVGRKDVEDALQRLDELTQEEARMAAAETLAITRDIDDNVKGVDHKIVSVAKGELELHELAPESQPVTWLGVKDTRVAIQEVANQVDHLTRSWSANIITADHLSLTSLPVIELRKDLRKWIAPPDPSVNLKTASGAHHAGTAVWCTEGMTIANWRKSGSLLWIHGKRTYPIIVAV